MPARRWMSKTTRVASRRACSLGSATSQSGTGYELTVVVRMAGSDVKVLYVERVLFNELAAALDVLAHQSGKNLFALDRVLQPDLEQRPLLGIHRGLSELLGIHLAQALVPLHGGVLLAFGLDVIEEFDPVGLRVAMLALDHYERRLIVLGYRA